MARARLLKPGFFTNSVLGKCSPTARLAFCGLWCVADREGRLSDDPARLKVEILPYDRANMDKLLNELEEAGFISRYESNGERYIQIIKFSKHQTPHVREPASTIPAPDEPCASTGLAPVLHQSGPAVAETVAVAVIETETVVPAALVGFDEQLHALSGYKPTDEFYQSVLSRYPDLDYQAEAIKLSEYVREKKLKCTLRRVYNWLDNASKWRNGNGNGKTQQGVGVDLSDRNPYSLAAIRKRAQAQSDSGAAS